MKLVGLPPREACDSPAEPSVSPSPQVDRETRATRAERTVLPEAVARDVAEEIRAAGTVIGGWVELLELGLLSGDEVPAAFQHIRAAQERIIAAGRRLELAAGIGDSLAS